MWADCKKYDGEKTTAGWMCGRRNKDRASPASTGSAPKGQAETKNKGRGFIFAWG